MNLLRSLFALTLVASAVAAPVAGPGAETPAGETAAGPLGREQFIGDLGRELATHFNLEGELQLDLPRGWTSPAKPAVRWTVTVTEFPAAVSAAMLVRYRIAGDGVVAAENALVFTARHLRDVWIAREPIVSGAAFDPAALDTRRVDLFRDREALPVTGGDSNFIYARAVGAGRTLTWRDLTRRPLVRKGDLVEVSISDGRLRVTMKGLALENGAQGDTVNVQNPDTRKRFAAVVTHENQVQVRF